MAQTLARQIYSLLLMLLTPAYLLRLWWRGRAEPLYRADMGKRLALYSEPQPSAGAVWVHAVSLGETLAAAALISALRAERPGMRLLLTHSTATGWAAGLKLLNEGDRQAWLPLDTPFAVRRFLDYQQPVVGVLMETEIWPNLLHACAARRLPVVLANARLSPKSLRKSLRLDALMNPAARSLSLVLAQTEDDAARLRQAGAVNVHVSGNLKFDVTPDATLLARGWGWRAALERPVLLAAVTREGEEAPLLAAWKKLQGTPLFRTTQRPLLVIVPRHPQRFDEVATLIESNGLQLARRHTWQAMPTAQTLNADVWLGDSMGEMPLYYALAHVALLGGSFAPLGGQNLIEAAACGCPVVMGPHTFNFAQASELAEAAGAAIRVSDIDTGVQAALALMASDQRSEAVRCALAFAAHHRGAAALMAHKIVGLTPLVG
jgi:3-deoxy-D-manno-octulosonic-acid transferase